MMINNIIITGRGTGLTMRKQVYSMALDKELVDAVDGAVRYFKYKSRSAFINAAIEYLLQELHQTLLKESIKNEDQ